MTMFFSIELTTSAELTEAQLLVIQESMMKVSELCKTIGITDVILNVSKTREVPKPLDPNLTETEKLARFVATKLNEVRQLLNQRRLTDAHAKLFNLRSKCEHVITSGSL